MEQVTEHLLLMSFDLSVRMQVTEHLLLMSVHT